MLPVVFRSMWNPPAIQCAETHELDPGGSKPAQHWAPALAEHAAGKGDACMPEDGTTYCKLAQRTGPNAV